MICPECGLILDPRSQFLSEVGEIVEKYVCMCGHAETVYTGDYDGEYESDLYIDDFDYE